MIYIRKRMKKIDLLKELLVIEKKIKDMYSEWKIEWIWVKIIIEYVIECKNKIKICCSLDEKEII